MIVIDLWEIRPQVLQPEKPTVHLVVPQQRAPFRAAAAAAIHGFPEAYVSSSVSLSSGPEQIAVFIRSGYLLHARSTRAE